jgi:hypothetical protein
MKVLRTIGGLFRINTRNWKAILLCFLTGIIFWLFNALNKNYTTNLTVPVEVVIDRTNFIPVKELPTEVRINLSGVGWAIFRRSLGINVSLISIPIEQPHLVKKIVGSSLPAIISSQLNDLQINYMITDTLYLQVDKLINKTLRLTVNKDSIPVRDGYHIISSVEITPDSVEISGPQSFVMSLENPFPLIITKNNIDKDFEDRVLISKSLSPLIKTKPDYAVVKFEVREFVIINDSLQLELKNVFARTNPILSSNKVNAEFLIRVDKVEEYRSNPPVATIDLTRFRGRELQLLPVVSILPEYVKLQRIDSVKVN